MSLFSCENITKSYNNIPTIQEISIHLNNMEIVSLLGVSGVGKTTLFNILAGVDTPDIGRVFLNNHDITSKAGNVSYMLQKDLLLEYKTIIDNVSLPLVINNISKNKAREIASQNFNFFGLSGYENKYPSQLSGGMRQRAALLRTTLQNKPVLLLDEPFSALDAITRIEMRLWYQNLVCKFKRSTIFVTHDIDEALLLSDRIYILSGTPGRITNEFTVTAPRPRNEHFTAGREFNMLKENILDVLELN